MAKPQDNMFIIWPEYFDSTITRAKGRRMPKALSVPTPNAEELFQIARKLGLSPVLEKEKSHPAKWMNTNGRIKVPKKYTKTQTMKMIAEKLKLKRK